MGYLSATVFTIAVLAIVVLGCWLVLRVDAIFNWLKGSRKVYGLHDGKLFETSPGHTLLLGESFLEIIARPFYKKARIFGNAACNWYIKNAPNGLIYLHSRIPMRPDQALKVIHASLSIHDLYRDQSERIAKLEQEIRKLQDKFTWSESHGKTWLASLEAIRQEIESDRQRYRSQAAQNIREQIEIILQHARALGQTPEKDMIFSVKKLWAGSVRSSSFQI